jgi:hypothetical protein
MPRKQLVLGEERARPNDARPELSPCSKNVPTRRGPQQMSEAVWRNAYCFVHRIKIELQGNLHKQHLTESN